MRLAFAAALAFALALPLRAASPEDAAAAATSYTLETTQGAIKVKKGEKGAARLAVVPKPGAHVSPEAPITVTLSAGPALALPKARLTRADSKPTAQQGVEVELPFTARAAGADELKASLVFYICLKDLCERQHKSLSFPVTIE